MTPAPAYAPARWLPGAHTMTVFASVARLLPRPPARRERWELPDGDFLDVDRHGDPGAPAIVILHGLEGSSRAPYVLIPPPSPTNLRQLTLLYEAN